VLVLGIVTALAAAAWVVLLIGHGSFWRTDQRLPGYPPAGPESAVPGSAVPGPAVPQSARVLAGAPALAAWPEVAAVVPARDEAAILPVTLPALLAQDYPGPFSVTLVDDSSTDGTGEVATALGAEASRPLRVVHGAPPPAGWAGKPWAMAQGLEATPAAAPYVLFTDADIAWAPGALRALVTAAEDDDRDLVSQMALLRTETGRDEQEKKDGGTELEVHTTGLLQQKIDSGRYPGPDGRNASTIPEIRIAENCGYFERFSAAFSTSAAIH